MTDHKRHAEVMAQGNYAANLRKIAACPSHPRRTVCYLGRIGHTAPKAK